jgi:signal transduction histidine kinase/CheY-like chemotaxis protein
MNSVLIIDDEESIRYSFEKILKSNGYDAFSCSDIKDAEKYSGRKEFNAAVVDRILGNSENGIDTAQKIKTLFPFCEIILVSAYPTFESAAKTLELNLNAYLTKPVTKNTLLEYVKKAVEKSKKRKNEQAFEKALELVFEKSPDGVLICDESGKVKYCNKSFKKIFLVDEKEPESNLLGLLDVKGCARNLKNNISEFFLPEKIEEIEVSIDSPGKKNGFYTVTKYRYLTAGASGFIINIKDITEKKLIEQSLDRAGRMEAIGNFAGGIAHDFNNILHVITGYGELALEVSGKNSEVNMYLKEILGAAERAANITEQILSFSRSKDEKSEAVNIEPLLEEVIIFLKSTIPSSISVTKKISKNLPPVFGSKAKIHQLIMNLASNSAKAMNDKGGTIIIGLEKAQPSKLLESGSNCRTAECIKLYVKDTGVGIEKENLDKIFQPFFTTREKTGGSGIGLSIVYGIVKKLGGSINVESEPGKGTLFEIFLPAAQACLTFKSLKNHEELKGSGKVLFVDDDKNITIISGKIISALGYEPEVFTDSEKALEEFLKNPDKFDAVITDMTMPKLRGDELAEKIYAVRKDIPIVISTGFSEKISGGFIPEGVSKILKKPVDKSLLGKVLKEIIKK